MNDPAEIVAELQRSYVTGHEWPPQNADGQRWCGGATGLETTLFDGVGAELARGYHEGRYSFTFCDAVVNALDGLLIDIQFRDPQLIRPKLFSRVYDAFDAGEIADTSLPPYDPVKTYTDPQIADIVGGL